MRYEILGSVRLVDNGKVFSISARKMEILLATLLIKRNAIVSTDRIIGEIWGEHSPRRAKAALHVYISQLRKLLSSFGSKGNPIVTRSSGYSLLIGSDELDLCEFEALVANGRVHVAAKRYTEALLLFNKALGLLRDPILGDGGGGDGVIFSGCRRWVEEIRLEAIEMMTASHLALGRSREAVGLLSSLIVEYPLHEEFYRQLMLALYRCRRRADALQVYRTAWETLRQELGLEPCRALRDLHQMILIADVDGCSRRLAW